MNGELNRAIADCTRAVELNPKYSLAFVSRGVAYGMKGEHDRAIADLDEAVRLDARNAFIYRTRGECYRLNGELDRAIADCTRAVELDPKDSMAYAIRSSAYEMKGERDRAIAGCDEAIRLNDRNSVAYRIRGECHRSKCELDRAIADFDETVRLEPHNPDFYFNRATVELLERMARGAEDAKRAFELYGSKNSQAPYALLTGFLWAKRMEREPEAVEMLDLGASLDLRVWPAQVLSFYRREMTAEAMFQQADNVDKQTEAHCYIGYDRLFAGDMALAREHFAWVRDNGNRQFIEYAMALAELAKLDRGKQ
jgi:tetratricopeptide (TPR) repeat protein